MMATVANYLAIRNNENVILIQTHTKITQVDSKTLPKRMID